MPQIIYIYIYIYIYITMFQKINFEALNLLQKVNLNKMWLDNANLIERNQKNIN